LTPGFGQFVELLNSFSVLYHIASYCTIPFSKQYMMIYIYVVKGYYDVLWTSIQLPNCSLNNPRNVTWLVSASDVRVAELQNLSAIACHPIHAPKTISAARTKPEQNWKGW